MTIKIGLLFSMTGTMSVTEEGQYQAALLAINEINENGGVMGKKLTPILRDICSSPQIAAKEVENLLSQNVNIMVGLYTSACRKSVLPILDKHDCLLFYPTQYEGGEQHSNVIYCGPSPNQILLDYIPWVIENLGSNIYLIGSDYIYPREMNKLIRDLIKNHGGTVVKESYVSLGEKNFHNEIKYMKQNKADVIFSTLVGESAVSLYKQHYNSKLKIPIASTITAETEIHALNKEYMVGHYSCFPYFNTIDSKENIAFKQKFKTAYGTDIISSAMENAYNSIHLLAQGLNKAQTLDTPSLKKHLSGLTFQAPQGVIIVDEYNQHLWLNSRIGQVDENGLFNIIWQSANPIEPFPFSCENRDNQNKHIESSLTKNMPLINELKKATAFFPYQLSFFDAEGVLLDIFDSSLKDYFKSQQFDIGMSAWTSSFLESSAITKTLHKRELSYLIGTDHKSDSLKEQITIGIPIEHKSTFYGVLGCFIQNIDDFNINQFLIRLEPLTTIIKQTIEISEKSKDFTFLYELLTDISNHLDDALIVKTGKNILFKNDKAEQLLNQKNELIKSIIRENFDDIKYAKRLKLDNQTKTNFDVKIVPIHDYRYIYIKQDESKQRNSLDKKYKQPLLFKNIIGKNKQFLGAIEQATIASRNSANVLILGESGTGKEVIARAIHNESERKNKPFIAVNCAAINENLIASELFGYVEGAFTGAKKGGSIGKFEQANGGTLFLDEIGDMPLNLQTTLLRVLQEREIVRVGGNTTIPINVRIIAATNKNLPQEIAYSGSFREDLFYRLNVFTIELIPLKDRRDDIYDLAQYFLQDIAKKENGTIKTISVEAVNCLSNYDWPGNIRELRNVMERAYYISDISKEIHLEHLPRHLYSSLIQKSNYTEDIKNLHDIKRINQVQEREEILTVLTELKGNISKSAQRLGISRNTLYKKIKEYNLTV